jgi:hypothetical protein
MLPSMSPMPNCSLTQHRHIPGESFVPSPHILLSSPAAAKRQFRFPGLTPALGVVVIVI